MISGHERGKQKLFLDVSARAEVAVAPPAVGKCAAIW